MNHSLNINFEGISKEEFYARGSGSRVSVLSGTNNCGKTLILKQLFERFGEKAYYCGTNRYYSIQHFGVYTNRPKCIEQTWSHVKDSINDPNFNPDPIALDFNELFIRMNDEERKEVYRISSECLGEDVELGFAAPGNSMSDSFLSIGTTPLAKCSSGSRMLVHLVSVLLSKQFKFVLIDEPELGLTPRIQNMIQ